MFRGFRTVAYKHNWQVHVLRQWHPDEWIPDLIRNWRLDAAFVHGHVYALHDSAIWGDRPLVTFSPPFPPRAAGARLACVAFDDHAVGACAAAHLLGRGLQSFAVVQSGNSQFAVERINGFRKALHGVPVHTWHSDFGLSRRFPHPNDAQGLGAWLRSLPRPCGIFAACDLWGVITLGWCQAAGVKVPEHVAIIGVDGDDTLCEFAAPPLTSIDLPWEQMGRSAAEQLAAMLASDSATNAGQIVRLPPGKVIMRKSTDILKVGDRDVREALAMISAQALGPLRPADVIAHVGASRNKLRGEFRRLVGRTLSEEIRRIRVEEARRLLSHSDLPIEEIAHRCGFDAAPTLNNAFIRVTGTTPGAFRKRRQL